MKRPALNLLLLLIVTGTLAAIVPVPVQAQSTLMASTQSGELLAIDITTGSGILVGVLLTGTTEIEFDNGAGRAFLQRPLGATEGSEFDITHGLPIGSPVGNAFVFTGLEVVSGTWYGTAITSSGGPSDLRTLNPFTGASVFIGATGIGPISGLAHDGSTMYGIAGGPGPAMLYTINLGTGLATPVGSTGIQAGSLQFGPDGRLYAGGTGADRGDLYTIDPLTGLSTFLGPTGFGTSVSDGITGLTLVDDAHFGCTTTLYAADGARGLPGNLYTIDASTGAVGSTVGAVGAPLTGLASHPVTCALWGTTSLRYDFFDNPNPGYLVTIDKATGAATIVGDILGGTDFGPADITFGSDGTLYGWSRNDVADDLIKIDLGTGAGTLVGTSGLADTIGGGLAASSSNVLFLSPDGAQIGSALRTIDPGTGLLTGTTPLSGDLVDLSAINALDFSCVGALYGTQPVALEGGGPTNLVSLGASSGQLDFIGTLPNRIDALAWTCAPPSGNDFYTLAPCRLVDTRNPMGPLGGPALAAGTDRVFPFAGTGTCSVPATATSISINIAVTGATAPGNVRLHPGRTPVPTVSSINYAAGQTRSNNAVVPLNEVGELSAFAAQASGTVHVIIDVNGYFQQ